jgi:hypothetical protein
VAIPARLGIGAAEGVLGLCGELREKKGQSHLLHALADTHRVRPARLLLIGDVSVHKRRQVWAGELVREPDDAARAALSRCRVGRLARRGLGMARRKQRSESRDC